MADTNGATAGQATEERADNVIILSDTTMKLIETSRMLTAISKDKNVSRQEQYYARQAAKALNDLVSSKVVGA